MKRFLKRLALVMLIAGLPMQNLHAVAMPLCDQGTDARATNHQSDQAAQDGDIAGHDHADHQHASADTNKACDGCSMCHACSAPAVASVVIVDALLDAVHTPPLAFPIHPSLFTPEQLQRPPSQFAA